jgi:uncharacterized repeat protein (TIGR01451 family)
MRVVQSDFQIIPGEQGTVSFGMDSLAAEGSATVVLGLTPAWLGPFCNMATLVSDQSGPVLSDNRASACCTVTKGSFGADLSVGIQPNADSAVAGTPLKYTIWVRNNGPRPAYNVVLTDLLPAGVQVLSTSPGCSVGEGVMVCTVPKLDQTDSVTKWLIVMPGETGQLCSTASVSAEQADPRLDNNVATNCVDVLAQPAAVHDLALIRVGAPRTIVLSLKKPSQTVLVPVTLQNRSPHNEIVTNLQGLVTLTVQSLGSCPDLVPVLHTGPPQAKLPLSLKPKQLLSVYFDVTFNSDCANDAAATSGSSPGHEDFRYMAAVHHEAIDGLADTHPADDTAPRSVRPPSFYDPNPDGSIRDAGVGVSRFDGTYGGDILTDLVLDFPANHRPLASDDSVSTPLNTPILISVLTNDVDADGDALKITGFSQPANGAVSAVGTNLYYVPNSNFSGVDLFTYTISDGHGGSSSATVTVTVTQANLPPTAVDDFAVTYSTAPAIIDVLANDTDPEGDPLTVVSFTQPANGLVTFLNNVATYTARVNFTGTNTFSYTISDGHGNTASATVTVAVLPKMNRPPIAADDAATTIGTTPVSIPVLENDTDPDNDPLNVISWTQPANGTVTFSGNIATYTANSGFIGDDPFTYTISDGRGGTSTANVIVTVLSP